MNPRTLAHYQLIERIGTGGMGEVWRATDTTLGRTVALKLLPPVFASDPERMARFEREARTLAALNHPRIAGVYGFHHVDGTRFIAMEFVPGEDLSERLARGPLAIEDALRVALDMADALEYAHERGVVHRDLKPANLKLLPDGSIRILDFGLARALETRPDGGSETAPLLSNSPTITSPDTAVGVILGTAAYMSPEQARGKVVDRRADIWSFGVILYEMLTGRRLFNGETITDVLAAVIREEPDYTLLPVGTPPRIRTLIERCLRKDPARRLRDIGDARVEIAEVMADPAGTPVSGSTVDSGRLEAGRSGSRPSAVPMLAWAIIATLGLGLSLVTLWRGTSRRPPPARPMHVALPVTDLPYDLRGPSVVPSPDGKRVAMILGPVEKTNLYVRDLDRDEAVLLPDTEDAWLPFFSPDGEWIAFFAGGKLRKIAAAGGPPVVLCDALRPRGGAWGPNDTILFTPGTDDGLYSISANGGEPEQITTPDIAANERSHRWPAFLPGGRKILFAIAYQTGDPLDDASIALLDLDNGKITPILKGGSNPHYAPTGHLLYAAGGSILSVPFDPGDPAIRSSAVPVLQDVSMSGSTGAAQFAYSDQGLLTWIPGGTEASRQGSLGWVDRKGNFTPILAQKNPYSTPRLLPDGKRIVLELETADHQLWIYDIDRGTLSRLTNIEQNHAPSLSPDGRRVAYYSIRDGSVGFYFRNLDGTGGEEVMGLSKEAQMISSWSPDSQHILFTPRAIGPGRDIFIMPVTGEDRTPKPLFETPASESGGAFSPDGSFVAYISDESGREEVYVAAFPITGFRVQISTDGGFEPRWSPDGRELYYRNGRKMMVASIVRAPTFSASRAVELFDEDYALMSATGGIWAGIPNYDVGADGRFVMIRTDPIESPRVMQARMVVGWFEELGRDGGR